MLGLVSAELHSSVDSELFLATECLNLMSFDCVSGVNIFSRETDRESNGELKGEDSAEEQVSLSPPLKYRYGFIKDIPKSEGLSVDPLSVPLRL